VALRREPACERADGASLKNAAKGGDRRLVTGTQPEITKTIRPGAAFFRLVEPAGDREVLHRTGNRCRENPRRIP
jgi:hypothetical protein